jgi:hypothetical protein
MPYTLWHCGVLIGETDFEGKTQQPLQYAGAFRPTAYGLRQFPLISGILTAASELKDEMKRRGVSEDDLEADEISELIDSSSAGRRVVDIGRALSEVELRDPTGRPLEFASIAFIDLAELLTLSRKLGCDSASDLASLAPDLTRHIVSATLRHPMFGG